MAGKLPAFTGLGALRHLDLKIGGVDQIIAGDAKAARGHLLDTRVAHRAVTFWILSALAAVGAAADAVHGDRERFMRFLADRAEGHGAGGKALDNGLHGFHHVDREGPIRQLEFNEPTQGGEVPGAVIAGA